MKILRLLGFEHPLTDLLEKELTQALVDRYKDKDKSFTGNLEDLSKNLKIEFDSQFRQWFSIEDAKVKSNWKEFKSIIEQQVTDTIKFVIKQSSIESYSKEKNWEILAVPKELLIESTTKHLPGFLKEKIQFESMDNATRVALAKYAVDLKFDSILGSLRSEMTIIKIEHRNYIYVEEIKNDHYYVDDSKIATRNTMLFLSEIEGVYSSSTPKEIKNKSKEAIAKWKQHFKNRPDNRRFISSNWKA